MKKGVVSRPKLDPPLGTEPTLIFVSLDRLEIDESYQRGIENSQSVTLIRRIAAQWDWGLCQPLDVARRADDGLFVVDGQHRLEAARLRGDIKRLPCVVTNFANAAEEAARFAKLNSQRRPLSKLDLFRAALASGDEQAVAIGSAISEAGLSLAPHSNHKNWKPGMISNIAGIERVWKYDGPKVTSAALALLGRAFEGQVQQYCGSLFGAVAALVRADIRARGSFEHARREGLAAALAKRNQPEWLLAAKHCMAEDPTLFAHEALTKAIRREWERTAPGRHNGGALSPRVSEAPVIIPKGEAFGLGANDWQGDEEWTWCSQCDQRRTQAQVTACTSKFCGLRHLIGKAA